MPRNVAPNIKRWIHDHVMDVKKYGIQEKETFTEEVIFSMEESVERPLTFNETEDLLHMLMEAPEYVQIRDYFEPKATHPDDFSYFDEMDKLKSY